MVTANQNSDQTYKEILLLILEVWLSKGCIKFGYFNLSFQIDEKKIFVAGLHMNPEVSKHEGNKLIVNKCNY